MRNYLLSLTLFCTMISSIWAQDEQPNMNKVSYSLGVLVAQNLKSQGFEEIDVNDVAQAISDVMSDKPLQVDPNAANQIIQDYVSEKQAAKFAAAKSGGEKFLLENAKRSEVSTTASGLQYEVLKPGSGAKPTKSNKVKVHYHGTLIDGTVFDSSVERHTPATFGVTQVIQGWIEGLQLMPLGAKYKFYIPQNLAYGQRGAPPSIPPFSALVFEVELLEIL